MARRRSTATSSGRQRRRSTRRSRRARRSYKHLKTLLAPAQIAQFCGRAGGTAPRRSRRNVLSAVRVHVDARSRSRSWPSRTRRSTDDRASGGGATLVLDMLPEDAQDLVFANSEATALPRSAAAGQRGGRPRPAARSACRFARSSGWARSDGRERRRRRDAAVLPPTARARPRGRGRRDRLGAVRHRGGGAPDQRLQPVDVLVLSPEVKEPDALGLAEFVGRTAPGHGDRAGPRPHVERAAARRDARRDPRRGRHDAGHRRAPRRGRARDRLGGEPPRRRPRSRGRRPRPSRGQIISVFSSKGGRGRPS